MHIVFFKDALGSNYKNTVEKILFFNAHQHRRKKQIEKTIEKYGIPTIQIENDILKIVFDNSFHYPSLYVLDSNSPNAALLGLLIYKIDADVCQIIHIAINEYCTSKIKEEELILFRLLEKLRKELAQKNIAYIKLPYSEKKIPVEMKLVKAWV